jgi:endoglucanase
MRQTMRATFVFCLPLVTLSCLPRPEPPNSPPSANASAPSSPAPTTVAAPAAPPAGPPAPIHAVSEVPVPAVGATSAALPGFQRGINLGNALDAPSEGAWGVTLMPEHFAMAKAAGLDHVRLPVRFSAHALPQAPYTIEEALLQRVDWALAEAAKNGLSIIIDLHHYEELMKQPEQNRERLVALWKQIATRYKDKPSSVAFELINEPCDALTSEHLNPIHKDALAAVRATNPRRIVIVNSYFWADAARLKELELAKDDNLVASFHDYQPILFTHQGMPWMGPEFQTQSVVFPGPPSAPVTPVDAAKSTVWTSGWFTRYNGAAVGENSNGPKAIFEYFKVVEDYINSSHRRVYMGEFGVADTADAQSRESWLRIVRQEAERRHIGWALWDDGGKFKALDVKSGSWTPAIKAGLFQ